MCTDKMEPFKTRTLTKEEVTAWVEALESGDYQQGQEFLRRGNQFCCLGVLCDVLGIKSDRQLLDDVDAAGNEVLVYHYEDSSGYLPDSIGGFDQDKYISLNDQGETFQTIAAEIRKDLLSE